MFFLLWYIFNLFCFLLVFEEVIVWVRLFIFFVFYDGREIEASFLVFFWGRVFGYIGKGSYFRLVSKCKVEVRFRFIF